MKKRTETYVISSLILIFGMLFSFFILTYGNQESFREVGEENVRFTNILKSQLLSELDKRSDQSKFLSAIIKSELETGNSHPLVLDELDRYIKNISSLHSMYGFYFYLNFSDSKGYSDDVSLLENYYGETLWVLKLKRKVERNESIFPSVFSVNDPVLSLGSDLKIFNSGFDLKEEHTWFSIISDKSIINMYVPVIVDDKIVGAVVTQWDVDIMHKDALRSLAFMYDNVSGFLGIDFDGVLSYRNYNGSRDFNLIDMKSFNYIDTPFGVEAHLKHTNTGDLLFDNGYVLIALLVFSVSFLSAFLAYRDINFKLRLQNEVNLKTMDLKKTNKRQQLLLQAIPLGIGVSKFGRWIYSNEQFSKLIGFENTDQTAQSNVLDIFPKNDFDSEFKRLEALERNTVESYNYRSLINDTPVEVHASGFMDEEAIYVLHDITSRQEKEERLLMFKSAINHSSQSILIIDVSGNIVFANRSSEKLYDGSPDSIEFAIAHELDICSDMLAAMGNKKGWTGVFSIDDTSKKYISRVLSPIETMVNNQYLFIVVDTNITESIEARNKEEHSQRLEGIGALAGGIAHDFNNLLTVILGNASLMRKFEKDLPIEFSKKVGNIENASRKAAQLCKQMLAYSGNGSFVVSCVDPHELIKDTAELLSSSLPKLIEIKIELNCEEKYLNIEADEAQMQQVFMNLIINASESIVGTGVINVIASSVVIADHKYPNGRLAYCGANNLLDDGVYFSLTVKDDGCGMDEGTQSKIFDLFFTTKFTGRGLGMSAVLGIINSHKGSIRVRSAVGVGTEFNIVLPTKEKEIEYTYQSSTPDISVAIDTCGKTVLVVDDEESIREFVEATLSDAGYNVIVASDGIEGLDIYRQNKDSINCIILDMTMPKMGGVDLVKKIREDDDETLIILSSGYSVEDITKGIPGVNINGILEKPYDSASMVSYVECIIAEK